MPFLLSNSILKSVNFLLLSVLSTQSALASTGNYDGGIVELRKAPLCDLSTKLSEGCVEEVVTTTRSSLVHCSVLCSMDETCLGPIFDEASGKCYLRRQCKDFYHQCQDDETNIAFFEKYYPCKNGGEFDEAEQKCFCNSGWGGIRCERLLISCSEMKKYYKNQALTTYLDIYQNGQKLKKTKCAYFWNAKTILFTSYGYLSFNKTSQEYEDGFEYDNSNFWYGLADFAYLTQMGEQRLTFEVTFDSNGQRAYYTIFYTDFLLARDETGNYVYTVSPGEVVLLGKKSAFPVLSSRPLLDCMFVGQGQPFSTWDNEQHISPEDGRPCASRAGAGWWFGDQCRDSCNPMGFTIGSAHPLPLRPDHLHLPDLHIQEFMDIYVNTKMYLTHE